jgi:hypothetical protein
MPTNAIRSHLRSNVVGYLALFLALSMGTAWAVERNSIRSKHIQDGQVKAKDVRLSQIQARIDSQCAPGQAIRTIAEDGAVSCETQGAIADGAVNSAKVEDDSLTGDDIKDDSLNGYDIQGLSAADMHANTLTGGQILESSLGEVPRATIAGHGGYGRDSGEPAFCSPTDDQWTTCASVGLTPSAPARFLVTGRFFASSSAFFPEDADGQGQCRLGSSALGGIPGSTVSVEVVDRDGDWVSITGITDVIQPGNHSFGLDCRETAGNLTTGGAHVSAVAISPF